MRKLFNVRGVIHKNRISFRKLGKLSSGTEKKVSGWAKPHTKDKSDVPPLRLFLAVPASF